MAMSAEKATKLGHDQVTHLEAHCFVLSSFCWYSTIFQVNVLHKRLQWLYSIRPNWGEWMPNVHTRIAQSVVFKISLSAIKLLNQNVHMVACCQWGDSRVWANNAPKSTLLKLNICAVTLELVLLHKLLTGPPQKAWALFWDFLIPSNRFSGIVTWKSISKLRICFSCGWTQTCVICKTKSERQPEDCLVSPLLCPMHTYSYVRMFW